MVREVEGSQGEVLLFILCSSVLFKFSTIRRHSCVSCIIISNISATTTTTKNWRERRGPKHGPWGAIDKQVTSEALKGNVIKSVGRGKEKQGCGGKRKRNLRESVTVHGLKRESPAGS